MYKIGLYILLALLSFSTFTKTSFASECSQSCTIESEPAQVLQDYIKNNKKVIKNISTNISKAGKPQQSSGVKEGLRIYNEIINWGTFSTGWEMLKLNLQSEVPYPITRDLQLLENEGKYLNQFLKSVIKNGHTYTNIGDVCSGISDCELQGTAGGIIGEVLSNHNSVIEFYRLSILGREGESKANIQLVPSNFKSELHNNYNKFTLSDCSKCEGGFEDIIDKMITSISLKDKRGKDGIDEWKKAWDLLVGAESAEREYATLERELLEKELSKQGTNANNGEIVLDNLDKYNNNGYTSQNNPVNNSFTSYSNAVKTTLAVNAYGTTTLLHTVKQIVTGLLLPKDSKEEDIPIALITQVSENIESSNDIMNDVNMLYQREEPFSAAQDLNSKKLQARIIQLHIDLSQAINILDKTIPLSEKVCNDQDRGNGRCKY